MSSIEGMGGRGGASILLNEHQALAPAQTDTNSTCEPREEGCVCMCRREAKGLDGLSK